MFAKVLYHEIGHHVQVISHSKLVQKEVFADKYPVCLGKCFSQQRYRYLRPFLLPLINAILCFIRKIELAKKSIVGES
jgi:hypothetical protein